MTFKRYSVTDYAGGRVRHARFVRAGNWVFGSGLRAVDASGKLSESVLKSERPLDPPPKAQREAQHIFELIETGLEEAGSQMALTTRLDQYYPHWRAVDPYHVARKAALSNRVAPSTSVIVSGLLNTDAEMDVQIMASTIDSGFRPETVSAPLEAAPKGSDYTPCLRAGDLIFLAGQLARDSSGNIAAQARVPDTQLWRGTQIRLETDYLIEHRIRPALAAAQSDLDLILKAQVYLTHEADLPAFWQSWRQAFSGKVPPTTIVPVRHPAFGTHAATIEVNVLAAHESARDRILDIDSDIDLLMPDMTPARRLDDLVFVAGLMGIDAGGVVSLKASADPTVPYYHDPAAEQMADVLSKAATVLERAGSGLEYVVRALHFHNNLSSFPSVHACWRDVVGQEGLPFSAIGVNDSLFVPGAEVILDLIAYVPGGMN